jgi:hypothetical protein
MFEICNEECGKFLNRVVCVQPGMADFASCTYVCVRHSGAVVAFIVFIIKVKMKRAWPHGVRTEEVDKMKRRRKSLEASEHSGHLIAMWVTHTLASHRIHIRTLTWPAAAAAAVCS